MATSELPRDDLVVYLRKLEARIAIIEQRSPLANTGLSVPGVGLVQVEGAIQSANYVAGVSGWRFDGTALEANTGVIGDGALANPITPDVKTQTTKPFAVTTTFTEAAGVDIVVPAGRTRLLANAAGEVYAINPNATGGNNGTGGDILWARVSLTGGPVINAYGLGLSGSYGFTTSTSIGAFILSGLTPGSTLRLSVQAAAAFQALGSDAANTATVTATLVWLS